MKTKITILLCSLLFSFGLYAQTVNIEGDPYEGNPYASINAAITDAQDGDVILISGVHTESIVISKSITLRGTDPETDIIQAAASPSSDGSGSRVINLFRNDVSDVLTITIENLGVRNGNANANGGGIFVERITGLATLSNLIIENNFTSANGGGIATNGSNLEVVECTIQNNTSTVQGGGLILAPNNAAGVNNVVNIKQSLIDNNTAANGGGIYLNGNETFGNDYTIDLTIENSTISNNTASSAAGAAGGGGIWARSAVWTTNAGGDGSSVNTSLKLVHVTTYDNTHAALPKSGIQFTSTGGVQTNFSAYNSVIVNTDAIDKRSINFANSNTTNIVNCILGGLQNAGDFLAMIDDVDNNNERGITATQAGLSGILTDEGGKTRVITIGEDSAADNYCTATVPLTLPNVDQRGFNRVGTPDAGAYEFGGFLAIPCDVPTGASVVNLAATGASFTWDSFVGAADGYEWLVVEEGDDPNTPANIVASGDVPLLTITRAVATGLEDATNYDFYVRSVCSPGDESDWSSALAFTSQFQGNLIANSRFTEDALSSSIIPWEGYGINSRVVEPNGDFVGFINNEGAFRQDFAIVPGIEYAISFSYRWVTTPDRTGANLLNPVVRDPSIGGAPGIIETFTTTDNDSDVWYEANLSFTLDIDSSLDVIRLQFFKAGNTNQYELSNVTFVENITPVGDFVYKNGAWSSDPSTATASDNIYVFNGSASLGDITASTIEVSAYADLDVTGVLTISDQLKVNTEGFSYGKVTFKSEESSTAQLVGGSVDGKVLVERFIPAGETGKRAFRFVTSSVDSDRSILNDWQENTRSLPGFGTHITGSVEGDDGFDATISGAPSMFSFDNNVVTQSSGNAWFPVTNTNVSLLSAGTPYRLFVRGDRTIDLSANDPLPAASNTKLRAYGNLRTGNVTGDLGSNPSNFVFVGNPYQAVVDMGHVSLSYTGVEDGFMYTWDPNIGVDGGFVIVSLSGGVPNPSSSGVDQYLQPGQSIFLRTNASAGAKSLTFTEASKATGEHNIEVFSENNLAFINIRLYETSDFSNDIIERDAAGLRFSENGNNSINSNDAFKLGNSGENLAIVNGNTPLGIESRFLPQHLEEVQLFMNNLNEDNYTLRFHMENMPTETKAFLKDNYLDTMTELEEGISTYSFDASTASSTSSFRFSIVFETISLSTENPQLADFKVYPNPVNDRLFLEVGNNQVHSVEVYNSLGQRVMQSSNELSQGLDVSSLSTGIYILNINTDNGSMQTKISKQ